jgi:hypothetical protein
MSFSEMEWNEKLDNQVKDEEEKDRKIWVDGNVETLVALCGEMEPKFVKNGKTKIRVGNPKPNIHNKTCKSCFKFLYLFFSFLICKLDKVHHFMIKLFLKIWGQLNKMTRSYEVFCKKARNGLTNFAQFESLYFIKIAAKKKIDLFFSFVNWI